MSNGNQETFEVIDPGFYERFHGIPAHYQMKVKKLGVPEAQQAVRSIVNNHHYNISGANARINQNSIDSSTNTFNSSIQALSLIEQLRYEVKALGLPVAENNDAMDVLDAVQSQIDSGIPKRKIVTTLLDSLPQAANIATIVSTLLSLISFAK